MSSTIGSVSHAGTNGDLSAGSSLNAPDARVSTPRPAARPRPEDAITELVEAAEALARTRLKPMTSLGIGRQVRDFAICRECQCDRAAHIHSCLVGKVLAACALLRASGALAVYSEAYAVGWADGHRSMLDSIMERQARSAVSAEESRQAVARLEQAIGADQAETRRVVCGRAVPVSGDEARLAFLCDLPIGHGDAWHTDSAAGRSWADGAEAIIFHPSGMVETRMVGAETEFDHSSVADVAVQL